MHEFLVNTEISMDFDSWRERLYGKPRRGSFMSMHDELTHLYEDLLTKNGISTYDIDRVSALRDYKIGKIIIPWDSNFIKFSFRTMHGTVEGSLAITTHNQIYFIYRGHFKKGIRKIRTATTFVKYLKTIKKKGSLD